MVLYAPCLISPSVKINLKFVFVLILMRCVFEVLFRFFLRLAVNSKSKMHIGMDKPKNFFTIFSHNCSDNFAFFPIGSHKGHWIIFHRLKIAVCRFHFHLILIKVYLLIYIERRVNNLRGEITISDELTTAQELLILLE